MPRSSITTVGQRLEFRERPLNTLILLFTSVLPFYGALARLVSISFLQGHPVLNTLS